MHVLENNAQFKCKEWVKWMCDGQEGDNATWSLYLLTLKL
jgi:hypothetical protein